jgi:hypothetical protein
MANVSSSKYLLKKKKDKNFLKKIFAGFCDPQDEAAAEEGSEDDNDCQLRGRSVIITGNTTFSTTSPEKSIEVTIPARDGLANHNNDDAPPSPLTNNDEQPPDRERRFTDAGAAMCEWKKASVLVKEHKAKTAEERTTKDMSQHSRSFTPPRPMVLPAADLLLIAEGQGQEVVLGAEPIVDSTKPKKKKRARVDKITQRWMYAAIILAIVLLVDVVWKKADKKGPVLLPNIAEDVESKMFPALPVLDEVSGSESISGESDEAETSGGSSTDDEKVEGPPSQSDAPRVGEAQDEHVHETAEGATKSDLPQEITPEEFDAMAHPDAVDDQAAQITEDKPEEENVDIATEDHAIELCESTEEGAESPDVAEAQHASA